MMMLAVVGHSRFTELLASYSTLSRVRVGLNFKPPFCEISIKNVFIRCYFVRLELHKHRNCAYYQQIFWNLAILLNLTTFFMLKHLMSLNKMNISTETVLIPHPPLF
jgi:hypothetical protein